MDRCSGTLPQQGLERRQARKPGVVGTGALPGRPRPDHQTTGSHSARTPVRQAVFEGQLVDIERQLKSRGPGTASAPAVGAQRLPRGSGRGRKQAVEQGKGDAEGAKARD